MDVHVGKNFSPTLISRSERGLLSYLPFDRHWSLLKCGWVTSILLEDREDWGEVLIHFTGADPALRLILLL